MKKVCQIIDNEALVDYFPGCLLLKDVASNYIGGNTNAAKTLGFAHAEELEGITDYDIACEAVLKADEFRHQDKLAIQSDSPQRFFDISRYANGKTMALIIEKYFIRNKNLIFCYCTTLDVKLVFQKINNDKCSMDKTSCDLTPRELQTLYYILHGKTAKEIGRSLDCSPKTVEKHIENIKEKWSCRKRSEIFQKARAMGLFGAFLANL